MLHSADWYSWNGSGERKQHFCAILSSLVRSVFALRYSCSFAAFFLEPSEFMRELQLLQKTVCHTVIICFTEIMLIITAKLQNSAAQFVLFVTCLWLNLVGIE